MYQSHTISIVIPCYNEEQGLKNILPQIPGYVDEIIIVDNNSTDQTSLIATKHKAIIIHESRQGYGTSINTGIQKAQSEIIVVFDGDNTYPIKEISKLVNFLVSNNLDFVSGSRFPLTNNESMNKINLFGNKLLTFFTNIIFHINLKDSQSGMWVLKKNSIKNFAITSIGMAFSTEIKIYCALNPDIKFNETHIEYHNRLGDSKLSPLKDGFIILQKLFLWKIKNHFK